MISNTESPQTKTKHTTQKTKLTSNTDTHIQKQNTKGLQRIAINPKGLQRIAINTKGLQRIAKIS